MDVTGQKWLHEHVREQGQGGTWLRMCKSGDDSRYDFLRSGVRLKTQSFKSVPRIANLENPLTWSLNKAQKRQILMCLPIGIEEQAGEGLALSPCDT